MTALIALHEVVLQSLLQGFGLDEDVHPAAMEHFVVDVDRHEKVVGMTGPVHEGVTESVDAAAAAHTDLADALDCELHPRVVQEKAAGAVHIAGALVAQLAACLGVVEQEAQVDQHENEPAAVVQEEYLGLQQVKAANLVVAGFEMQHEIVVEAIKVAVE